MTNEQTIDAIMRAANDFADAAADFHGPLSDARAGLRCDMMQRILQDKITAALAAKDAEIAALTQRLTDSGRDLQVLKADPAPGEWVEWKGGECPIAGGVRHQVRFRNCVSSHIHLDARSWSWGNTGGDWDIIAYRIAI